MFRIYSKNGSQPVWWFWWMDTVNLLYWYGWAVLKNRLWLWHCVSWLEGISGYFNDIDTRRNVWKSLQHHCLRWFSLLHLLSQMDAECTVNKKPQCLAQQAKLGTQKQSSVSTQAHKLIYAELMRPRFMVGPYCSLDTFKFSRNTAASVWERVRAAISQSLLHKHISSKR